MFTVSLIPCLEGDQLPPYGHQQGWDSPKCRLCIVLLCEIGYIYCVSNTLSRGRPTVPIWPVSNILCHMEIIVGL